MTTLLKNETCAPASCELCRDTPGFVFVPGESRRVMRCVCRTSDLSVRSVLPPLLHGAHLSAFAQPLVDVGNHWMAQPTSGILLTGGTGTGKSWYAAGIVRALVGVGRKALFKCAEDFYLDIRSSFNKPDISEVTILGQFSDVEFLVLDDIGAGSLSDFERRSTLHVLDRRISFLRPTIVTSNLTLEGIAEKLDERIASRLSGFTRIVMTGRDRRAAK